MYLADVIRRECWDDMSVKGRGIVVSVAFILRIIIIELIEIVKYWLSDWRLGNSRSPKGLRVDTFLDLAYIVIIQNGRVLERSMP